MSHISEWLAENLHLAPWAQGRLVITFMVVVVLWLLQRLVMAAVDRRTDDVRVRYQWKKGSVYLAVLMGAVILVRIWLPNVGHIGTYLGLLSAGVAIALKDPLVNLAGWAFIFWRRPFGVGDRIQIGEQAGDVIDLRIFQFSLMEIGNWVDADQSTGRVIHIPNGRVFTESLANYVTGFQYIWNEIAVLVTFESDWRKAKSLLREIARSHAGHLGELAAREVRRAARKYMIFYSKLTPRVYTDVQDSGVRLTIRYLCDPRQRRGTAEAIWEDVLGAFADEPTIDFAYPTQRFYRNEIEGKSGTRPDPTPDPTSDVGSRE